MPDYVKIARQAAKRYGVDPDIFERQIRQESGFNPNARSPAGANGIAQIMPATARGWGVDSNDPVASLNAAAKNMARYVRQYGSYENALRAYNAGPGAIEDSKNYRETNNYVQRILQGGRDPGRLNAPRSSPGGGPSSSNTSTESTTTTTTTPGVDNSGVRRQLLQQYVLNREDPSALLGLAQGLRGAQDVPGSTSSETVRNTPQRRRSSQPSNSGGPRPSEQLLELFYDPLGGVKRGQEIGAIGGHGSHVHVASGPKQTQRLKKLAQDMGLTVTSEDEGYDGDGVHTSGSYHYKKQAVDVAGSPELMAKFAKRVAKKYGVTL